MLNCDLDFEQSNQISPQDILAYDAVPPNQVWFQRVCSSEDTTLLYFNYVNPLRDLENKPIFPPQNTLAYDDFT